MRNWYARLPSAVQNADALVSNAEECAQALRQGVSPLPWARLALLMTEETQTSPGTVSVVLEGGKSRGGVHVLAAVEASDLSSDPLAMPQNSGLSEDEEGGLDMTSLVDFL